MRSMWFLSIAIFIIAFFLRLIAALKIPWRPDEIVYVDRMGTWFSHNFLKYIFQIKHQIYPPSSPIFGNPPLAMWLLSLGVWLAEKFHFSILLGARLINVFIGSLSTLLLFRLGSKWFSLKTGVLAGLAFALLPVVITNNATAYLDTTLVLFVIVAIDIVLKYLKTKKSKYLYFLGLVLGLSILVKFTMGILILAILLLIPAISYRDFKEKKNWLSYVIFIFLFTIIPIIIWSGFHDLEHAKYVYSLFQGKTYSSYILSYPSSYTRYYFLMLIGILAPIITVGFFYQFFIFIREFKKNKFEKNQNLLVIILLILVYYLGLGFLVGYGASNQLLPIIPLILLVAAAGLVRLIDRISLKILRYGMISIILIFLILPLTGFSPADWGLYSSIFVGEARGAFKIYPVGSESEALPLIADYFNRESKENSNIAVMAYDWTLKKYLLGERTTTSLFPYEDLESALARKVDYIVVPRIYFEGNTGRAVQEINVDQPVRIIYIKGIELARIYKADTIKK